MTVEDQKLNALGTIHNVSEPNNGSDRANSDRRLKHSVKKRSLVIWGHKTSVSLEDPFWFDLRHVAQMLDVDLSALVASIDAERTHDNLSSAIRVFLFERRGQVSSSLAPSERVKAVLDGAKRKLPKGTLSSINEAARKRSDSEP